MTLDDLYALFQERLQPFCPDLKDWTPDEVIAQVKIHIDASRNSIVETEVELVGRDSRPLITSAKQYVIARDQGIDAVMLWKLANRGAQ